MTEEPVIAGKKPVEIMLKAGEKMAFCACGRSSKQPLCDGSHKGTSFRPKIMTVETDGSAWICMCKHSCNFPFCDGTHNTLLD